MSHIRLFTVLGLVLIIGALVFAAVATASSPNNNGVQGTTQVKANTPTSLIEFREHRMGKYGPSKFDYEGAFAGNRSNWAEAGANGHLSPQSDALQDSGAKTGLR